MSVTSGTTLVDKVCIVTGASEGIGEAIARILAVDGGANVILASRQIDKLNLLIGRLQAAGCPESNVIAVKCDVTKREDAQNVYQTAIDKYGKVDILVNCAGLMYYTLMKNLQFDVSFYLNFRYNCSLFRNGQSRLTLIVMAQQT